MDEDLSHGKGLNELKNVVLRATSHKKRIPIMFCAVRDEGLEGADKEDLPGAMTDCKTFRIGAADDSGQAYKYVSYSNDSKATMYLFPGVDIQNVLGHEEDGIPEHDPDNAKFKLSVTAKRDLTIGNGRTGSFTATALAAGLAALLLHCTKLGVHYTQKMRETGQHPSDIVEPDAVRKNGEFYQVNKVFSKFGITNKEGLKYANPGAFFEKVIQDLRPFDMDGGGASISRARCD